MHNSRKMYTITSVTLDVGNNSATNGAIWSWKPKEIFCTFITVCKKYVMVIFGPVWQSKLPAAKTFVPATRIIYFYCVLYTKITISKRFVSHTAYFNCRSCPSQVLVYWRERYTSIL